MTKNSHGCCVNLLIGERNLFPWCTLFLWFCLRGNRDTSGTNDRKISSRWMRATHCHFNLYLYYLRLDSLYARSCFDDTINMKFKVQLATKIFCQLSLNYQRISPARNKITRYEFLSFGEEHTALARYAPYRILSLPGKNVFPRFFIFRANIEILNLAVSQNLRSATR